MLLLPQSHTIFEMPADFEIWTVQSSRGQVWQYLRVPKQHNYNGKLFSEKIDLSNADKSPTTII